MQQKKKQKGCGQYRRRQFLSFMYLQKKIQLMANTLSLSPPDRMERKVGIRIMRRTQEHLHLL